MENWNGNLDLGYNTLGFARARCLQYNQTVKWFGPDVTCEGQSIDSDYSSKVEHMQFDNVCK